MYSHPGSYDEATLADRTWNHGPVLCEPLWDLQHPLGEHQLENIQNWNEKHSF